MDFKTLKNDFKIRFKTDAEPDCVFSGHRLKILGDYLPDVSDLLTAQLSCGTGLIFSKSEKDDVIRVQNANNNICYECNIYELDKYQEEDFTKEIFSEILKIRKPSELFGLDMLFVNNTDSKLFCNSLGAVKSAFEKMSNKSQNADLRLYFQKCKVVIVDAENKPENLISLSKKVLKKVKLLSLNDYSIPEKTNLSLSEEKMYRFMLNEKKRVETAKKEKKIGEIYKIISASGDELISFSSTYSFVDMYKFIKKTKIAFTQRPCFENSMIFAVVADSDVDRFIKAIESEYKKKADKTPAFYICDTI